MSKTGYVKKLSYAERYAKYMEGWWECEPPAVSTMYWTAHDWIAHIDEHGCWL